MRSLAIALTVAVAGCGAKTALEEPPPPPPCTATFGALPMRSCEAQPPAIDRVWPTGGAMDLVAGGCGVVALVLASEIGPVIVASDDGGATFGGPFPLPAGTIAPRGGAPHVDPIAIAEERRLLVLVRDVGEAVRVDRSDDLGRSWTPGPVIAESSDAWQPSLVAEGPQVVVHWMTTATSVPRAIRLARSTDGGRSFDVPVSPGDTRAVTYEWPSVCLAGEGVVVGWLGCDTGDCVGADRTGTSVAGVWSIDADGAARSEEVYAIDDGWQAPRAGCARDGRAMLGWSTQPYARETDGALVIASVEACGARDVARVPATDPGLQPESPRPVVGASGALAEWGGWLASYQRWATIGAGGIGAIRRDVDVDGDGDGDLVTDACALTDGGYALLVTAGYRTTAERGRGVGAILDDAGQIVATRALGPFDGHAGDWAGVRCDGLGRAHFGWVEADGARYAALARP